MMCGLCVFFVLILLIEWLAKSMSDPIILILRDLSHLLIIKIDFSSFSALFVESH